MLPVILNDRPLRQTLTGVGHYIRQILLALPEAAPEVQVAPFFYTHLLRRDWRSRVAGREATAVNAANAANVALRPQLNVARRPSRLKSSRKPWWLRRTMQGAYAWLFRRFCGRYALYHEPNHIPMRCDLPTVTTVHDLSVLVHPEWHPADRVRWYEAEFAAGVRQTRRFIAASEFTKREMIARLGVPAERIDVTYQAAREAFAPPDPSRVQSVLRELGLGSDAFLYVGTLEPRKNLPGLLAAYAALPAAVRRRHPLVIVGAWGWNEQPLRQHLADERLTEDVRLLGYMTDDYLACLYASCRALVWPTLYEGFGLPPLEAMACGAAVIVSDVASLPEVVGDAGLLIDPLDVAAWTAALSRAAEDEQWIAELRERGRQRAAQFSWARCAQQTAACYRATLGE